MTMTLIQTVEVGAGGAASIDFTSIPQTGTDLMLVVSGRGDLSLVNIILNNDSTAGRYSSRSLSGSGSSVSSYSETNASGNGLYIGSTVNSSKTANTFSNQNVYIPNYTLTGQKSISVNSVNENNAASTDQTLIAGNYNQTSSITSIKVIIPYGTWVQYSTASLYKIEKGSGGATVS